MVLDLATNRLNDISFGTFALKVEEHKKKGFSGYKRLAGVHSKNSLQRQIFHKYYRMFPPIMDINLEFQNCCVQGDSLPNCC